MKDEDIQNLLGGFATDTLTDRERELLFTASLTNQELFNALADDQALREFLSDPASRRRLLQALQAREPGVLERLTSWMRRPASWAVAGSVMAALVVAVAIRQSRPPALSPSSPPAVEMAKTEPPSPAAQIPTPVEPAAKPPETHELRSAQAEKKALRDVARSDGKIAAPAKDREASQPANMPSPPSPMVAAAPQAGMAGAPEARNEVAAGPGSKLKIAVLDFDSSRAPAKEADTASADVGKTASDLLGKKLDSNGYTVIDRKEVDRALQEQNLSRRQLDASTAAGVGRSLGADAVIMGSVKQAPQIAQKGSAMGGAREAAPASRAKAAAGNADVQVTAQAINSQTANNMGVAFAQGEQTPGGGLARAVDQVASSLGQQMLQNVRVKIDGLVTAVNASVLTLNVGLKAGIKAGDRLEVKRAGKPIGRVVISSVKDSSSVGAFEGTGPVRIGDSVTGQ